MSLPRRTLALSVYLLPVRLWLGYSMITGGQSIFTLLTTDREFFQHWFGHDLGFPAPLFMAFLAKATEFVGGILICLGLVTRVSASLIAVVMLVATLGANIDYHVKEHLLKEDAVVTISSFLFACLLVIEGGGKYSLDNYIFKTKFKLI
jgi:uncharacterized membrane protein YphA (DoxX/SURF4 family)